MSKEIQLTRGMVAIVDDDDWGWVSAFNWYAQKCGKYFYAARRRARPELGIALLHRDIMNAPKGVRVDHKNHDTMDYRRVNLRLASGMQNVANSYKYTKPCSSQFKGVCYVPNINGAHPWMAYVGANLNREYLGYFETEIEAARAYNKRAHERFKEFAFLNKI